MARVNATGQGVRVVGLNDLNRALRELGPDLQRELKRTNLDVAQIVADDARSAALQLGGVAAHVAPSIRASARNTAAGVSFGGAGYPMAAGAEFGAYRFKQFQPWRGNDENAGYFVYPAIRQDADRIETEYGAAIDKLLDRNGLR